MLRLFLVFFLTISLYLPHKAAAEENLCSTPQRAISTFLDNLQPGHWNSIVAATCIGGDEKLTLQLKQVLDAKGIYIQYDDLSVKEDYKNEQGVHKLAIDPRLPEIAFERVDEKWLLTARSKQLIPQIYSSTFSSHVRKILDKLPALFFQSFIGFQLWQYLFFFVMIIGAWFIGRIIDKLITSRIITYLQSKQLKFAPKKLLTLQTPIVWITISLIVMAGIPDLQLSVRPSQILHIIVNLIFSISVVMLCSRAIDLLSEIFLKRAAETDSKLDDQIVPLIKRASKTLVWLLGIIFILQNMGIRVTALVAFGSVGGVAIALASKDTVENLFGSFIVFIDQPFQIGDWVAIDGSIEGVVEEVGFRSTLIRSFEGSIISVPNAKIAHCSVNNYNKRERRRFKTTLSLRYDTPRVKIEAYLKKVREFLNENPNVFSDGVFVYLNSMSSSSLDIMVYTFFIVDDWRKELEAKEECFLTFMKFAEELDIGFAFPTTTVELEQKETLPG